MKKKKQSILNLIEGFIAGILWVGDILVIQMLSRKTIIFVVISIVFVIVIYACIKAAGFSDYQIMLIKKKEQQKIKKDCQSSQP